LHSLVLAFVLLAAAVATAQEVSVANGIGYGTTGVYARTFGTVIVNSGTAITYVPDAVNGDSFVINSAARTQCRIPTGTSIPMTLVSA
jgi:hypothetical protein